MRTGSYSTEKFLQHIYCAPFSSLEEVWVAVLNITGPLSNWSFADNKVPGLQNLLGFQLVFNRIISDCIIYPCEIFLQFLK